MGAGGVMRKTAEVILLYAETGSKGETETCDNQEGKRLFQIPFFQLASSSLWKHQIFWIISLPVCQEC